MREYVIGHLDVSILSVHAHVYAFILAHLRAFKCVMSVVTGHFYAIMSMCTICICLRIHCFMFVHVCSYILFLCLSVLRVERIRAACLFAVCECVRPSQGNYPVRLG